MVWGQQILSFFFTALSFLNATPSLKNEIDQRAIILSDPSLITLLERSPEIIVTRSTIPTASAERSGRITISQGALNLIEKREQLAFIIAHEIAHLALNHHSEVANRDQQELEADRWALNWLAESDQLKTGPQEVLRHFGDWYCGISESLATCRSLREREAALKN